MVLFPCRLTSNIKKPPPLFAPVKEKVIRGMCLKDAWLRAGGAWRNSRGMSDVCERLRGYLYPDK